MGKFKDMVTDEGMPDEWNVMGDGDLIGLQSRIAMGYATEALRRVESLIERWKYYNEVPTLRDLELLHEDLIDLDEVMQ